MKREANKPKKQRQPAGGQTAKPACGTLSYLAECRGARKKTGLIKWVAPPDSSDKMIRK